MLSCGSNVVLNGFHSPFLVRIRLPRWVGMWGCGCAYRVEVAPFPALVGEVDLCLASLGEDLKSPPTIGPTLASSTGGCSSWKLTPLPSPTPLQGGSFTPALARLALTLIPPPQTNTHAGLTDPVFLPPAATTAPIPGVRRREKLGS